MGAGCSSSRNSNAQDPDRRGNGALRRGSNASSRSSSDSPVQELNGDVGGADKKRGLRKDFSSAADVIIEKAKDFWKELKDLPIPATDGLTTDQLVKEISKHEWDHHGVDLKKAIDSDEARVAEVKKMHHTLSKIRKSMSNEDVVTAKSMGLLDANGKIHKYDVLSANDSSSSAPMPPDAVPFAIWGWKLAEAAKFQNAKNELIAHNICNLIHNFQVMRSDDISMMVKMFMQTGIWGLGQLGLRSVWNVLATLPEVTPETEAFAILSGIKSVGEKVIKFAINAAIVAVIAPLFTRKNGNAAAVMVILNDSNEDMEVVDIKSTYGKVVGMFKEQVGSTDPKPVIPKRMPPIVNAKTKKIIVEGSIQACFFAARKRENALTGSLGALQFASTSVFPKGLFIGWDVPFAYRNNRIVVSVNYDESAADFSNFVDSSENDDSQESHSNSSTGGKVTGRVNSAEGSQAYYIVNLAGTVKPEAPIEASSGEKATNIAEGNKGIKIADVTSGKSTDQLMEDILNHEKEHYGIDWHAAAQQGDKALRDAVSKAHDRLHELRKTMEPHEVENAKAMGLLDADGAVKTLDLLGDAAVGNPDLAPIPSQATTYPCWGWTLEEAAKFQNATGDEIKKLILNLIRNFQVMGKSDERYLVDLFMEMGLVGLGAVAVHAVWKCLKIFDTATSIADVIVEVGIRTIQFAVAVFVLAILVPIFVYAMKDAAGVMVIINDTFEDMNLEALTKTHGKVTGIFKENDKSKPALPIIPKRLLPAYSDKGVKMNSGSIFAGFIVVRKKESALVGTQGALKFSATKSYPNGVYIGWEVPLSGSKNRLLVSADYTKGADSWSEKTNDDGKQEDSSTSSMQATVTGRVNNGSGSQAFYVVNIGNSSTGLLDSSPTDESIEQKAEKFWDEIKDLKTPDVTSGKTSDEVIADIIKHEKTHHGIDWEAAAKGGKTEMEAAMKKAHSRMNDIRNDMSAKEVDRAKSMGLLDSKGQVPFYDILGDGKAEIAPIPSGAVPYTIWGWKVERAAQYQTANGERIKELITNLVRNFQVMGADDERSMTKMFTDSGLWAIGGFGILKVVQVLRTLYKLTRATEAFAVVSGIMEVGFNVIKIGIAAVVVAILVPLFVYMNKDACAIFVILNDSEDDLDLTECYTTHGKVVGIFKENPAADNPKPIIPKRLPPIINPKTGVKICEGSIQAGFFAARKHDNALVGTQGALKFGATTAFPKGVFLGWEVPLSGSSNRLLVSVDYSGSTSQFSDKTNDDDKQEDTANGSNGAKVVGRVHDAHGSQGYYVFNVTVPKKKDANTKPALVAASAPEKETNSTTDDELINQIFEHEKNINGIDWRSAVKEGHQAVHQAIKKARGHLQTIADKMTKEERHHAMNMGMIDSSGKVPEFDLLAEHDGSDSLAEASTVPIPSTAVPYMVWGWKPSVVKGFENAFDNDIKRRVLDLVRNFQAMQKDSKEQMVNGFMKAGLWGIGLAGLRAVWKGLRAVAAISEAVEAEVIAEGIAVIGLNVVTLAISACILAVLVPIFIFMSKNAAAVMVIINNTDEDMRMVDLYATHGKVVGIFKENADLDNPQPILPRRLPPIINPTTKKVIADGSVLAGFFAARKRDNALQGTQGGMKFEATERYPQGICIGWEVPLTLSSNRLLVSARFAGSASDFSDETNNYGEPEDSSQSTKGAVVSGRVNSRSGSEGFYIFTIN